MHLRRKYLSSKVDVVSAWIDWNKMNMSHLHEYYHEMRKNIKILPKFCGRKARKSAALTVKKTKMQSCQNFGHEQDPTNYLQANKVFWQTVRRLRGKWSHTARSIKDQNGVLLRNEKDILGTWRENIKHLSNPVTITPQNTYDLYLGEEIPSLQPKSLSLSKHWRVGRMQAVMKSDVKCSKPWIEEFFDWLVCVVWPGVLEGAETLANWGDHSHTQEWR